MSDREMIFLLQLGAHRTPPTVAVAEFLVRERGFGGGVPGKVHSEIRLID
jgi:hypothetical protein